MNELTGWTFQVARMKLFRSDLELILWHFETNNPCEGEKFIGIFYNIFRGYSIKKTYTSFVSKLSWPTSDETAAKSVLSLQDLFLDLETNFRYKSNSSNSICLRSGDPWQLIHWKNRCWNEKRFKQISDNYTYNKVRISRISVKFTLKKNCHGGCHWGFVLHCAMCITFFLHTFDSVN